MLEELDPAELEPAELDPAELDPADEAEDDESLEAGLPEPEPRESFR